MATPLGLQNIPKEVQPSITSPESQLQAAAADSNSLAAISMRTQVIAAQAIADSEYDPPVPPPRRNVSGFQNYRSQIFLISILATLLIVMLAVLMHPTIRWGSYIPRAYLARISHLIPTFRSRK